MDELLSAAPCGFLSFADNGIVTAVNETLLGLLGQERSVVESQHIGALLSAGGRVFYQTHLFPLLKLQGRADEIYLSLRTRDGEDLPVLLNAIRRDRTGGEPRTDCVIVPMRLRERYEAALLEARKAAEEAAREREKAYGALALAHDQLAEANIELEVQQEELLTQQDQLLEANAQLHARAEREALLNRIAFALRASTEPEEVLNKAVTLLAEALKTDRCYFAEYDVANDIARVLADWRRPDLPSLQGAYRISDFDLDITELYGSDGLILSRDIQDSENRAELFSDKAAAALGALGVRSGIGVALFEDRLPVASLNVAMASVPREWTSADIQLVQAVATQMRTIAEEARLRYREHRTAETLQAALQPALPKNVPGLALAAYYRPGLDEASIGGDFYDVFRVHPGCYALVVADLSGKGLQAAAQIATVRHMLRAQLYQEGATVAQALTSLNRMLTDNDLLSGFATLFVGTYDAQQRTLTYVNAGQEPGLLRRAGTGDIDSLMPTGPVLGGYDSARFTQASTALESGDVLALFTDGLTEAGRTRKDLLEIEGVTAIFAESARPPSSTPEEIAHRVITGVLDAVTISGIRDDVCLLIAAVE